MRLQWFALLGCAFAANFNPDTYPGYLKLSAVPGRTTRLEKRDYEELTILRNPEYYHTVLQVGSNRQRVSAIVDIWGADTWVIAANNTDCVSNTTGPLSESPVGSLAPYEVVLPPGFDLPSRLVRRDSDTPIDCSGSGTFNPNTSTSFESNGTAFAMSYQEYHRSGFWGSDIVRFGNVSVNGLLFEVSDSTNDSAPVLGLGTVENEQTASGSLTEAHTYENFLARLKTLGVTNSTSYSLYLDGETAESTILFGAIDRTKYVGDLSLFPIVNHEDTWAQYHRHPTGPQITLNMLTIGTNNTETVVMEGSALARISSMRDISLPQSVFQALLDAVDVTVCTGVGPCVPQEDIEGFTLTFNFQGVEIQLPLINFMSPIVDTLGENTEFVAPDWLPSEDDTFLLGYSFLHSVYFVADYDNYQIALAPANPAAPTGENIQLIVSGIPNATSAPNYDTVYGAHSTFFETLNQTTLLASATTGPLPSFSLNTTTAVSANYTSTSETVPTSNSTQTGTGGGASSSHYFDVAAFCTLISGLVLSLML